MTARKDVDVKPYSQHDSRIGYCYRPNAVMTLATPDGGDYTVRVNAQGIRSDREFTTAVPPGKFRIVVAGDSLAAGQYCANHERFTELLESSRDDLEVINFALEGSGTDQQLLIFEDKILDFDFDLMLFCPYLDNIRRNLVDYRMAIDPNTGQRMLVPKPRFDLVDDRLVLRNVPVPDERFPLEQADPDMLSRSAAATPRRRLKSLTNRALEALRLKRLLYKATRYEPFPEYRDAGSTGWRLMAAMIEVFVDKLAGRPLVIAPQVYRSYLIHNLADNYLTRFRSLNRPGLVTTIDILPHFRRLDPDSRWQCYWSDDCHYTPFGHRIAAEAIAAELHHAGLLPS